MEAPDSPDALHSDLLETSSRLYHKDCAELQIAAQAVFEKAFGEELARTDPEDPEREKTVSHMLAPFRKQVRDKCHELIWHAELTRRARDEQILSFHPHDGGHTSVS